MAKLAPGKTAHDVVRTTGLALRYKSTLEDIEIDTEAVDYSAEFGIVLQNFLRLKGIEIDTEAVDCSNPQSIMDALADCATCGDVVSLFSRRFQLVLPINDDERALAKQLLQETRHEDMEAAKRAWEIKYIISDKVLELVARQLLRYAEQWDSSQWYVPLTALVQSSGWGKSRLMCQMWRKGFYVVYISCMKDSQSGFPRRTRLLADIMQDSKSTESSFVALVASIMAVLSRHADTTCEEWMAAQEKSDDIQQEIHAEFQTMVKSIGEVKSLTRSRVETYHETFCKAQIDKLKQGARVLLCVDEAGELGDNFAKFRRS